MSLLYRIFPCAGCGGIHFTYLSKEKFYCSVTKKKISPGNTAVVQPKEDDFEDKFEYSIALQNWKANRG